MDKEGGFSISKPWIQMNDKMGTINVETQIEDKSSIWNQVKSLSRLESPMKHLSMAHLNLSIIVMDFLYMKEL